MGGTAGAVGVLVSVSCGFKVLGSPWASFGASGSCWDTLEGCWDTLEGPWEVLRCPQTCSWGPQGFPGGCLQQSGRSGSPAGSPTQPNNPFRHSLSNFCLPVTAALRLFRGSYIVYIYNIYIYTYIYIYIYLTYRRPWAWGTGVPRFCPMGRSHPFMSFRRPF